MAAKDEISIEWLEEHIGEGITANLVNTLRKLFDNNKNDFTRFAISCKALGRLREKDDFLPVLFRRLAADANNSKESFKSAGVTVQKSITTASRKRTKIRLPFDLEEDDDISDNETEFDNSPRGIAERKSFRLNHLEEEDDDENSIAHAQQHEPKPPRVVFKKIKKEAASKLREYSASIPYNVAARNGKEAAAKDAFIAAKVPDLQSYRSETKSTLGDVNHGKSSFADSDAFSDSSEEQINEDREWYNHDDDYGNPVADETIATKELDFIPANKKYLQDKAKYSNSNDMHNEIQLYALPINRRKELIPYFLESYTKSHNVSNSIVIGSFLRSSQEGYINPFKNPEGTFAINARAGSKLVNVRRLARDQTEQSKQTAEIAGTSAGNVLGIKEDVMNKPNMSNIENENKERQISRTEIEESRRKLPAYRAKSKLLQLVRDNQICVIIGETGSGKTTQLAQYLHEAGLNGNNMLIGCTQPRRVAAMSVAKRVALEMDVRLGEEVGYAIRFEDKTSTNTKIKFMTDGILLREALLDDNLEKYSCIIIDEAHERSLNTDIILGILKRLVSRRRDLKLIITSATMNATKFSKFFGSAPLFTIPGRTYPQKIIYTKSPVDDYVEAAVMQAVSIHVSTEVNSGDILIFMTGQEDIETTAEVIKQRLMEVYSKNSTVSTFNDIENIEIFTIYSALPGDIQNRIFEKLTNGKRKVVIATNIAETSLTIDGIRYVIDCGYSKLKVYNPKIGLDSLAVTPISRANADQRSGRASRTAPGTTYRLYTADTLSEDMFAQAIPEIQRTNLSNTVLLLKSLGVDDVMEFPFIDPPPLQTLLASLYELFFIGALDTAGHMTPLGTEMSKFPLQPSLCKILLIASQNGCSEEMLTIVSMLSVPQVFYRPKERMKEADLSRRRFFVPNSDHLTLLNVFSQWKANHYSHRWCNKHFLHFKSLQRAREVRLQLEKILQKQKINLISAGSDWDIIRKCICSGFAHQSAKRSGLSKYVHLKTGMDIQLHPTSALYGMGDLPPYVVYHELLMTRTEYICCVTSVDPFWLMEYGGLLYDIKRIHFTNDSHTGFLGLQDDLPHEDDKLDDRLKRCLEKRDAMIQRLKEPEHIKPEQQTSRGSGNAKKARSQNVQIGFIRRRPF